MRRVSSTILFCTLLVLCSGSAKSADCWDYAPIEPPTYSWYLNETTEYFSIASRDNFAYASIRAGDPLFTYPKFVCLELGPNTSSPVSTRSILALPTTSNCTVLKEDHALLALGSSGIGVVDISNPDHMPDLSLVPTGDVCRSLALLGPDLLVTAEWSALRIYDFEDPLASRLVGSVPLSQARAVVLSGNLAFLACGNLGLAVVDISNPTVPVHVAQVPVGGFVDQIAVENDRVYLTGYLIGMVTVDVTTPSAPSVVATLPLLGEPASISTRDGFAYILVEEAIFIREGMPDFDAMVLVRLNRPAAPALDSYNFVALDYSTVALGPDRVFLGEGQGTADLIQAPLQCPAVSEVSNPAFRGFILGEPFPNPFNPRVEVRFTLPEGLAGRLRVYDLGGHLVAEIWQGSGIGSEVAATWDGSDQMGRSCPSGTYRFVFSGGEEGILAQTSGTLLR